jgi:hypothetical protein
MSPLHCRSAVAATDICVATGCVNAGRALLRRSKGSAQNTRRHETGAIGRFAMVRETFAG